MGEERWGRNWSKVEVTAFEEQTKLLPMEEVIRGLYESFISPRYFCDRVDEFGGRGEGDGT